MIAIFYLLTETNMLSPSYLPSDSSGSLPVAENYDLNKSDSMSSVEEMRRAASCSPVGHALQSFKRKPGDALVWSSSSMHQNQNYYQFHHHSHCMASSSSSVKSQSPVLSDSVTATQSESDVNESYLYATQTNSRLLHVLSDLVKTFLDTEGDINRSLERMGLESREETSETDRDLDIPAAGYSSLEDSGECEGEPDLMKPSNDLFVSDLNSLTSASGAATSMPAGNVEDDVVLGASRRLRSSVDRVLRILNDVITSHHKVDFEGILRRNEELVQQLDVEVERREKLTQELLQKERTIERLAGNKLLEKLHAVELAFAEIAKQKDEKLEESRRECENYVTELKASEKQNSVNKKFIDEQTHDRESERDEYTKAICECVEKLKERERNEVNLRDYIEGLERQISMNKKFIDEQTHDRESEREEYNKTIAECREKLKEKERNEINLRDYIDGLQSQLNALTEDRHVNEKYVESQESVTFSSLNEDDESQSYDCSNGDVNRLDSKLSQLNRCIDKLTSQNAKQKIQLDETIERNKTFKDQIEQEMRIKSELTENLNEARRARDMLQNELSEKHLLISTLKTRLESNHTAGQLKGIIEQLKEKINDEESRNSAMAEQLMEYKHLMTEKEEKLDTCMSEIKRLQVECQQMLDEKCKAIEDGAMYERAVLALRNVVEDSKKREKELGEEVQILKHDLIEKTKDNDTSKVLPNLLQMIINDKNEEIENLNASMKSMERKLRKWFAENHAGDDDLSVERIIDELITVSSKLKSQVKKLKVYVESSTSPKKTIWKEKCVNTDNVHVKHVAVDATRNDVIAQMQKVIVEDEGRISELVKMVNCLEEEREVLKKDIVSKRQEVEYLRQQLEAKEEVNRLALQGKRHLSEPSGDDNDEETEDLDSVIQTLHDNSLELVHLSSNQNAKNGNLLKQLIDSLPFVICDDSYFSDESDWQDQFVMNFPDENLGSTLVEKLRQIHSIFAETKGRMTQYSSKCDKLFTEVDKIGRKLREREAMCKKYYEKWLKCNDKIKAMESNRMEQRDDFLSTKRFVSDIELYKQWRQCVSHKKSLIYQKKYLLMVLGGFQLTERATLNLLANMDISTDSRKCGAKPLSRFKSAVYVVISLQRMKYLVVRSRNLAIIHRMSVDDQCPLSNGSSSSSKYNYVHDVSSPPLRAVKQIGSPRANATNASLEEYVNRLQQLHTTLGLKLTSYDGNQSSSSSQSSSSLPYATRPCDRRERNRTKRKPINSY